MPVYLVIHKDDGFLGAVRAIRAEDEAEARDFLRSHLRDNTINLPQDYELVCVSDLVHQRAD
jgi:hypothetical protein